MRLLFVSTAGHFGGTERWASMAIAELEERGHEVWMACPDLPHATRFTGSDRLWHDGPTGMFDSAGKQRLATFCRENRIDALIPVSQRAYFPAGQVARKLSIACVVRLGIVRLPLRPVVDWYGYGIYPHAIIVNTQRIKQVLARAPFVRAKRIHVVYNGIVRKPVEPVAPVTGKFVITTVGTLSYRKGQQHLIKAVALLPEVLRAKVLVRLIGDGPAREKLEHLAKSCGLEAQIEFCGHVENPAGLVGASDLFVLLSSQEGISNALLEAMDAGIASYATLVGGHGEFLRDGENAWVANSRTPKQVAADLEKIMQHTGNASIAAAGQACVRRQFTLSKMGDRLEEVLSMAVNQAQQTAKGPDA